MPWEDEWRMRERRWITPASRLSQWVHLTHTWHPVHYLDHSRAYSQENKTMSYASDASGCGFEARVLSSTPEPSISVALSRESSETYEASVDTVPSAHPEPALIPVPLFRRSSQGIEKSYVAISSASPVAASIPIPRER